MKDGVWVKLPRGFDAGVNFSRERYLTLFQDLVKKFEQHRDSPYIVNKINQLVKTGRAKWRSNSVKKVFVSVNDIYQLTMLNAWVRLRNHSVMKRWLTSLLIEAFPLIAVTKIHVQFQHCVYVGFKSPVSVFPYSNKRSFTLSLPVFFKKNGSESNRRV